MAVAEFVVVGGDYIGVWEETPKNWIWKSFSKMTVPIALRRNGSYNDMMASVIEAGELDCEPRDLVISYQMNGRGKVHPTFINNDRNVSLYMLDIDADGSRPTLRKNIITRLPIEPPNSFNDENDNNSAEDDNLGDHLVDNSNESLCDDSTNMCDHQMHMGQEQLDSENFESFEDLDREGREQELLGSQPSIVFRMELIFA